uniref:non-specific serine/threonine protein kinase n=1 Tax=Corethrella appendiculata TaxID=1370023 RepID=U5ELH4_9DIPT
MNSIVKKIVLLLLIIYYCECIASVNNNNNENDNFEKEADCTAVAKDEETLLVFSTLGGGLTAIDPLTSEIRWSIDDEPTIKVPTSNEFQKQQYLPDPRDGSLYLMNNIEGGLKKLPYTIPQLVASAPCRSSDGILYSGKKSDSWFLIDPKTGRREKVVGFGSSSSFETNESIGWATSRAVYLGRTQYTVMMYDSLSTKQDPKRWNVTFFDYSSHTMAPELTSEYEFLHITSSATGSTATFDRHKGTYLWQKDLSSPVVAVFLLGSEGLLSVPFTTVSDEVFLDVIEQSKNGNYKDLKLFQTLYVGEHSNNIYAIPSLVDKNTPTLSSEPAVKLLDGASNTEKDLNENDKNILSINKIISKSQETQETPIILLGHYQMPKQEDDAKFQISPSSSILKNGNQLATIDIQTTTSSLGINNYDDKINQQKVKQSIGVQTDDDNENGVNGSLPKQNANKNDNETTMKQMYQNIKKWLNQQPNKIFTLLIIVLFGIVIFMFWYFRMQVLALKEQSQNGSQTSGVTSSNRSSNGGHYQESIEIGDGEIRVGKIIFNCNELLGKGCEGTFVFKGTFEKRNVAVKRLLPECFTLADREVTLLSESDKHENVVRYFCTEQDRQFRYIAVELCDATLQDYSEGKRVDELRQQISVLSVLYQATNGLNHLHSLNIVHRDIKPQNILLSHPDNGGRIRVMISDFGLCKKLNIGKNSFSRRSGVTGTEGWIAAEMLRGQRTTTSVDIFSLGCVFYYVFSYGLHPFGENIKRQGNILSSEYDLKYLSKESSNTNALADELIADMISKDSIQRPTASAILNHPLFWREETVLSFLQNVSDRVEKADILKDPLRTLEKNAKFVVREDWMLHLDTEITNDLKKYRGYQGFSVRDLLRALRNKYHHYHELSYETQKALGSIPNEFTRYWINRFPYLVSHSYHALERCSNESQFKKYYKNNQSYKFTKPQYFNDCDNDNYELMQYYEQNGKLSVSSKSPKRDNRRYSGNNSSNNNNNTNINSENGNNKTNQNNNKNRRGAYNFNRTNNNNNNISIENNIVRRNNNVNHENSELVKRRTDGGGTDKRVAWNLQQPTSAKAED